ncbi:hypothetical protein M5K25_027598 [Dendrobium thyrsiflorum]|uniref:Uncharacterized protein n=1 Tax=Dendrobium thyrsiflorum TaxID=117978 RepID=A0ABD0TUE6_DENTH
MVPFDGEPPGSEGPSRNRLPTVPFGGKIVDMTVESFNKFRFRNLRFIIINLKLMLGGMKTSPIKIPWFRRPGLSCSLVYLVRGGSRPNLTEGTLSTAMGCFVQEYLVDLGWIFEENPATFRRPLPGAGREGGGSGRARSGAEADGHARFGLGIDVGGGSVGIRLEVGWQTVAKVWPEQVQAGDWRSVSGLAVGDGLDGGRSGCSESTGEVGLVRPEQAAVVESSPAQMHLQHFGEFADDQVDQPHFLLHVQFVFQTPESFVPSFLSSCCSVLKSPYLSPSSEISNAFVLVLTFQQALLLLDHHFDHHPRRLLLLLIARTKFDLLESWLAIGFLGGFSKVSTIVSISNMNLFFRNPLLTLLEALTSKFLCPSTGIFCQQISEYEVQVSCSNVHNVELILVFLELLCR